ncbi:hypothetical protein QOZ80_6AG0517870 [Eleusine coracana subsp. coracana]|nr:hypothetical protein QOZ80_6AG0517870 [Eleusine coracana subsp. coracana]
MANGRQSELAIDLPSTTPVPGQGNGNCEGDSNTLEDGSSTGELGMVNGSSGQEPVDGSSTRSLLASSSHESSVSVDFQLLWRLRKYLVLLGILAVTVTYNAGLMPPGGFWEDNKDGHEAGDPVLRALFFARYQVFFYCNATAFAASLVLIILLLSKHVTRQKLWLRSIQFTMILDLFSLMGAYAAGSCRAVKSSIYIWVLVLAVFVYILIHILVSTRVISKELKQGVKSMLQQILSKNWGVHVNNMDSRQEKDVEEARKFILMLVTFAASVTYQAGLSPPGGFWNEMEQNKHPATSMLRSKNLARYNFFVSCNSTSFVASLVTIILLLSPDLSKHGIRSKAVNVCVVADLLGLIGAYAAGSSRSVATSFYVVVVPVIVWLCFAVVTGFFVHKPVAQWLKKNKPNILRCMHRFSRVFSLDYGHSISNTEQKNSASSSQQSPGAAEQESTFEQEHQPAYNKQFPNFEEDESQWEHQPGDKLLTSNAEESVSNSDHKMMNYQQPENTSPSTDHQSAPKEAMAKTGNLKAVNIEKQSSSIDDIKNTNGTDDTPIAEHQSTDMQHIANMNGRPSSANDLSPTVVPAEDSSEMTILASDSNGATNDLAVEKEYSDVPTGTTEIEIVRIDDDTRPLEIGNNDITQNANNNSTDEHLDKSRTYLLLLAILAVSLAYQSGLTPPGGFWSKRDYNNSTGVPVRKGTHHRPYHMPGDPILEDMHHQRYIAFFYLNAIAFVASLVMTIMLLNLKVSRKVLKRYALQIAMIVDLLALTGSYVMGSCRRTQNSIYISLLVGFILSYVVGHVLIAIHVIPEGWKQFVAEKLDNLWPNLPLSGDSQRDNANEKGWGVAHNQRADANEKEWERRRNLLLMLAVLAATVTYQAGMNPPGGVWPDDKDASGKRGDPILQDNNLTRYSIFYHSNSFSFVSSVVITILLVNKESCEHGIKSYALRVCLVVGLLGLLIAYSAGSCRKAKQSIYLIFIAAAVLTSLVIQVRLLSSTHDTREGPTFKFVEYLLELLVGKEEAKQRTTAKKCKSSGNDTKKDRKKHKYLMLLAILAASITYQAGLNPPGGTWPDDDKEGHVAGNPVLLDINPRRYNIFFWFNSISLMTSIVVIMFLLNKSVWKKDVPLGVLHMFMVLILLALMTAFAAGSCRKFRTSVYVYALVVGVVIYLVITIFLSVFFAKCLKPVKRSWISSPTHRDDASRTEELVPEQQV